MTTATAKAIESIKRSIRNLQSIQRNIMSDDYESLDALARTIRNLECDVDELELDQQPARGEESADSLAA